MTGPAASRAGGAHLGARAAPFTQKALRRRQVAREPICQRMRESEAVNHQH
jgi:hypothetical protein